MRRTSIPALLFVLLGAFLTLGFRTVPYLNAGDIIAKVKTANTVQSELDLVKMVTLSSTGDIDTRQIFSAIKVDPKGNYSYLLRFLAPEDEKGVSLLVIEKDNGDVQQYLYLPALGEPREIVGKNRAGYFMGSDFTYEDLRKEKPNEWTYSREMDDKIDGQDFYVVLSAPVDKDRERITGYTNRMMYIDKTTFTIRRIEFFNSKNQRLKVFDAYDYESVPGQPTRPRRLVMTNNTKNTTTTMALTNSLINYPLPDSFFTLDTLSKWGPAQDQIVQAALNAPALVAPPPASTPAPAPAN